MGQSGALSDEVDVPDWFSYTFCTIDQVKPLLVVVPATKMGLAPITTIGVCHENGTGSDQDDRCLSHFHDSGCYTAA
jgi:hypothetical protein